jgi:hypothetical protein
MESLDSLSAKNYPVRHIVLLSDGQTAGDDPRSIIPELNERKISLSTVIIGDQPNMELMRSLAEAGGGSWHRVDDPRSLPRVFVKESLTLRKSMLQNVDFVPVAGLDDSGLLKGFDALPPLHGYVMTSPKDDPRRCASVLLGPGGKEADPLLALGRFGVGRSAAFTSDFSSNWGRDWIQWAGFEPFVKQLLSSVARVARESSLRLSARSAGGEGVVTLDDFQPDRRELEAAATVRGPDERRLDLKLERVGPRRYQGRFKLWGDGRYQVMAVAGDGKAAESATDGFVSPYSAEYLRFRSDASTLERIARESGGRVLDGSETPRDVFVKERETKRSSRPVYEILLAIVAALLPLDVAVRRVQFDPFAALSFLRRKRADAESSVVMGSLLRRKKDVSAKLEPSKSGRGAALRSVNTSAPAPETPPKVETEAKPPADGGLALSTTEKLLAKKRRRD